MELKVGDKIPSFSLKDQKGNTISKEDLVGVSNLVLYFYPKDDKPGCTKEACAFRDEFEVFTDLGAKVIGVSADSPQSHAKFAEKYRLPFTLLSDEDNSLRKSFGVKGNLLGLLPGRVTFIVDKFGIVKHVFDSQFNATQHVKEAKDVLLSLSER